MSDSFLFTGLVLASVWLSGKPRKREQDKTANLLAFELCAGLVF